MLLISWIGWENYGSMESNLCIFFFGSKIIVRALVCLTNTSMGCPCDRQGCLGTQFLFNLSPHFFGRLQVFDIPWLFMFLVVQTRRALTTDQINEACYVDMNANKAVFDSLRNNPKVKYDGKCFSYKVKLIFSCRKPAVNLIRIVLRHLLWRGKDSSLAFGHGK